MAENKEKTREPFKVRAMNLKVKLKAPKNLYNSFGKYSYRNAEGICEAVKPLLEEFGMDLKLEDQIILIGDRFYIKATATLSDCYSDEFETSTAYAREDVEKKGMDGAQLTGSCSSYARKYSLNGLFLLDDTKDADTDEYKTVTTGVTPPAKPAQEKKEMPKQISDMKASPKQIALIKSKMTEKGITVGQVCTKYGVKSLEELPAMQVTNVLHAIDVTPSKKQETIDKYEDDGEQLPWK